MRRLMHKKRLAHEHRKYLAQIAWAIRKANRALPPMEISPTLAKACQKQGYKLRGLA